MDATEAGRALGGGALIGLGAALLLVANGRIAGVSGIVGELLTPRPGEVGWRACFLCGMAVAGLLAVGLHPEVIGASGAPPARLLVAGLLVGFGTRMANGCTSGHGVCGIPRGSTRSIVATLTFLAAGMATVTVARWLGAA